MLHLPQQTNDLKKYLWLSMNIFQQNWVPVQMWYREIMTWLGKLFHPVFFFFNLISSITFCLWLLTRPYGISSRILYTTPKYILGTNKIIWQTKDKKQGYHAYTDICLDCIPWLINDTCKLPSFWLSPHHG